MSSSDHNEEAPKCFSTSASSSSVTAIKFRPFHLTDLEGWPLSTDTEAVLGGIHEEEAHKCHVVAEELVGRRALVYFTDNPAQYEVVRSSTNASYLAPSGPNSQAKGPPIQIDPRSLSAPGKQLPLIRTKDIPPPPEPVDDGPRSKKDADAFPQMPIGGKNIGDRRGGRNDDQSYQDTGYKKVFRTATYNAGIETAIEMRSKLPPTIIGAVEFLVFFPDHTKWPAVIFRLMRHGWIPKDIARVQLFARGQMSKAELKRRNDAMRHQVRTAVKRRWPDHTPTSLIRSRHPDFQAFVEDPSGKNANLYNVVFPLPTSGTPSIRYEPPRNLPTIIRPPLLAKVVYGILPSRWPIGQDEGPLTKALRWAKANGKLDTLTTDDIPTIIAQQNFTAFGDARTERWDIFARDRMRAYIDDP